LNDWLNTLTDPVFLQFWLMKQLTSLTSRVRKQLSPYARFVGDDFSVEEYFLKFVPVTDLSGKELDSD